MQPSASMLTHPKTRLWERRRPVSTILRQPLALILNSRQSKTPLGTDTWVHNTVLAVRDAVQQGLPVIASIGMNTWELALWGVGDSCGQAIVICPTPSDSSHESSIARISYDFSLDPDHHAWVLIPVPRNSRSRKAWWEQRDRLAFDLASHVIPVSVRPKGRWEEWLESRDDTNTLIDERFRVTYQRESGSRTAVSRPHACSSFDGWDYLTHWTCRCHGPWPGERGADFYRDVVSSDSEYARSASRTLARILTENRLRGSSQHIREGRRVVAFTALSPHEALPLMRWRRRYVRPTFEPYGIAIRRPAAIDLGIRRVTYILSGHDNSPVEPCFTQGYGTGNWPAEAEWRAVGDVNLACLSTNDIVVLVPSSTEAESFRSLTRFPVRALSDISDID